jgi:nesprin-1
LKVDNLLDDLKDGSKLVHLLEVLSGETLPVEKGRIQRRPHFLSNCNTAIEFLKSKKVDKISNTISASFLFFKTKTFSSMQKYLVNFLYLSIQIKLVNINASDIVDGRPSVVLGLIWTIILYFQVKNIVVSYSFEVLTLIEYFIYFKNKHDCKISILFTKIEENYRALESLDKNTEQFSSDSKIHNGTGISNGNSDDASRKSSIAQKWKVGAKEALLMWCRSNSKIQVQNFGKSWRDGRAFLGIVSSVMPSKTFTFVIFQYTLQRTEL